MSGRVTRWAIAGAGRFVSDRMAWAIAAAPATSITGVWARQPHAASVLAERLGARTYRDPLAIAGDPCVDVVYVAATASAHPSLVEHMLSAGKHVLCEKPIAPSAREVERLITLTENGAALCFVNHHLRANTCVLRLRSLVDAGELGRIRAVTLVNEQHLPIPAGWRTDDNRNGGVVLDLTVHDLDLLRFLFGRVEVDRAVSAARTGQVESQIVALLTCREAPVLVRDAWLLDPSSLGRSALVVVGELGTAILEPAITAVGSNLHLRTRARRASWHQRSDAYRRVAMMVNLAVSGRTVPLATAHDAVHTMRSIEVLRRWLASMGESPGGRDSHRGVR